MIVSGGRVLRRRSFPALVVLLITCVVWSPSCCGLAEESRGGLSSPLEVDLWLALWKALLAFWRMPRPAALLAIAAGVRHSLPKRWGLLPPAPVDFATKPVKDGVSVLPMEGATNGLGRCLRL